MEKQASIGKKELFTETVDSNNLNFNSFWKTDAEKMEKLHNVIRKILSGQMNLSDLDSYGDLYKLPPDTRVEVQLILNSLSFKVYKDYFLISNSKILRLQDLIEYFCTQYFYEK